MDPTNFAPVLSKRVAPGFDADAWEDLARGLLRDNDNEQRLTRFEREERLREIETALAK